MYIKTKERARTGKKKKDTEEQIDSGDQTFVVLITGGK
jgi:hypothetical protein